MRKLICGVILISTSSAISGWVGHSWHVQSSYALRSGVSFHVGDQQITVLDHFRDDANRQRYHVDVAGQRIEISERALQTMIGEWGYDRP